MAKRRYSDDDRANALVALDANQGNENLTSKQLGIPRQTIQEWVGGKVPDTVPEIRQLKRAELADKLEELAHMLADAMPEKIPDATLVQIATSLGIAIDKMQILRGFAITTNGQRSVNDRTAVHAILADPDAIRHATALLGRIANGSPT